MKKIVISLFKGIMAIIAKIYSPKLSKRLYDYYNVFYSEWLKNEFYTVGKNFGVRYPLYLHGGKYISIGTNFIACQRTRLEAFAQDNSTRPRIKIGNNVQITMDCHIGALQAITIKDNVLIGSKTIITDHFHGRINEEDISLPPAQRNLYFKGEVIIEENVWIGEGVAVMPGVTIGANSIVGANSVVTRSVPPNSVVAGNPCRIIKSFR